MKKLLLSSLLLAFVSIFTFGCSSDSDSSSSSANPGGVGPETVEPSAPAGSVAQIDLNNPETLVGTYDITFFYTDAKIAVLTNDCDKLKNNFSTLKQCTDKATEQVTMTGEATIEKTADGKYQIKTKVQMAGGVFNGPNKTLLTNQDYNYTVYTPIPTSEIDVAGKTINSNKTITGTTGRNLTENITKGQSDTYVFKLQDGGTLLNEMTSNAVVPAEVRVIMKKKNNDVIALDANKQYKSPAITGFVENIQ